MNLQALGLKKIGTYAFNDTHHSNIYEKDDCCIIIDDNLGARSGEVEFDYSKYCEMQNKYMSQYHYLFRFNDINGSAYKEIEKWLHFDINQIELSDKGGHFYKSHVDNTPIEEKFEELFPQIYGADALSYLHKEESLSLPDGHTASIDYALYTTHGPIAIELNGVTYHHPMLVSTKAYDHLLLKQNVLNLYGYKVYRFSTQNITFIDQLKDSIRYYLGRKRDFKQPPVITSTRQVKLYKHQENILHELNHNREQGIHTSLIVIPTGTGKSQIAIEDMIELYKEHKIHNALIMVPSKRIEADWLKRTKSIQGLSISIEFYNTVFMHRLEHHPNEYDYILFDEAHHAQAANCRKTLAYFTPKYLVGLTATDERLDHKKLEEVFGQYERQMTLKEAVDEDIITNIRCYRLKSNIDLSEVRYNGKDYNYADLNKTLVVESRDELIVETVVKYFSPREDFYKQGIIFCVNKDHTKRLEKLFSQTDIVAKAVYGGQRESEEIFKDYANKKVQFLLSCQLISEGWDSPQTEVVVMARPTLSKVLYTQQLGRGVRKYPGKECLYVIDVVDEYTAELKPWCFNALFHLSTYSPFMGLKNNNSDYLTILGLKENEIAMEEVDIFTFEEKYKDYHSLEETARILFKNTNTVRSWLKKNKDYASLYLPLGNKMMPYFSDKDIERIRTDKNLTIHDDSTILKDFEDFVEENTLTFSYKLIFLLAMFDLSDQEGEVSMEALHNQYRDFYLDRLKRNLPVDRQNCPYTEQFLNDYSKLNKNILSNPFEKFERKNFIYHSKDLGLLCFNPILWNQMTDEFKQKIVNQEHQFLKDYYEELGGL